MTAYILHLAQETAFVEAPAATPWGQAWTEIVRGPARDLRARFDLCVTVSARVPVELGCSRRDGLRVALWMEDGFRLVQRDDVDAIIYSPGLLGCLEAHRPARATLVAARAVAKGRVLAAEDLETKLGGDGLAAARASALLGRPAAHDLKAGDPVDFGCVL